MYKVRNNLTPESLTSIYYTLCYPHLTYCASIWAYTWHSFINKISIAQNGIFRCIFYINKFESTRNIMYTQSFLIFTNIHKYFLLLSIYNYLTQYRGAYPFSLLRLAYNIRDNDVSLISQQWTMSLFKRSILYSVSQLWNSLPLHIKTLLYSGNLSILKKSVKSYFYNYYNFVKPWYLC